MIAAKCNQINNNHYYHITLIFQVMSNHSPTTSNVTNGSVTGNNNIIGCKPIEIFKWTTRLEKCLLRNMVGLKPCGINKHLSMLLLKEKMYKELKLNIPIIVLWNYVSAKWDIRAADCIERIRFDTSEKDFVLPEDFDQLVDEEGEKIKNLNKECLNNEINEKKLLILSGTTRSKSNSMSSVDSKDDLNEMIPSTLLQSSPAKTNEVGSDDPCIRISTDKIEVKAKICNRVTSDLLVVQQSLDNIQSLGRRSCSKKKS